MILLFASFAAAQFGFGAKLELGAAGNLGNVNAFRTAVAGALKTPAAGAELDLKASVSSMGEFYAGNKLLDLGALLAEKKLVLSDINAACGLDQVELRKPGSLPAGLSADAIAQAISNVENAKKLAESSTTSLTGFQKALEAGKASLSGVGSTLEKSQETSNSLRDLFANICLNGVPSVFPNGQPTGSIAELLNKFNALPTKDATLDSIAGFLKNFNFGFGGNANVGGGSSSSTVAGATTPTSTGFSFPSFTLPSFGGNGGFFGGKTKRQTGIDVNALLAMFGAASSPSTQTTTIADVCKNMPAKTKKRQVSMNPTDLLMAASNVQKTIAPLCTQKIADLPAAVQSAVAAACSSASMGGVSAVNGAFLSDLLAHNEKLFQGNGNFLGGLTTNAASLKASLTMCQAKLASDVKVSMASTALKMELASCSELGKQVVAMTSAGGATMISADVKAKVQTCQSSLAALRKDYSTALDAAKTACPQIEGSIKCIKRFGSVLQLKFNSLFACSDNLVEGLQNGIASISTMVDTFCADAANAALCTKFKQILLNGEATLTAVADATTTAGDALCRRAGAIKVAFADATSAGMTGKRAEEFGTVLNKMCSTNVADECQVVAVPLSPNAMSSSSSASVPNVKGIDDVKFDTAASSAASTTTIASLVVAAVVALLAL